MNKLLLFTNRTTANVMAVSVFAGILMMTAAPVFGQSTVKKQVDSLFMIASSGDIKYKDMVQPAIDACAALGAEAVPFLIDRFDTKSARERVTLEGIIKKIGKPATPLLIKALTRPDELVVQRAAYSLGDINDSDAVGPLMASAGHESWQVRDQVVGALGKIGDMQSESTVLAAFSDSIGQVRKSAAVSAGRMTIAHAITPLVHQLGDDFYGARLSAYHSLLQLDTAGVMAVIGDSVNSANNLAAGLCCKLLGEYGTDEAKDILLKQTALPDPGRRAQAALALIAADPLDNCQYRRFFVPQETDRLVRLKIESAIQAAEAAAAASEHESGQP